MIPKDKKAIAEYQETSNGGYWKVRFDVNGVHGESICNITTRNSERAMENAKLIENAFNFDLSKPIKEALEALENIQNGAKPANEREMYIWIDLASRYVDSAINTLKSLTE